MANNSVHEMNFFSRICVSLTFSIKSGEFKVPTCVGMRHGSDCLDKQLRYCLSVHYRRKIETKTISGKVTQIWRHRYVDKYMERQLVREQMNGQTDIFLDRDIDRQSYRWRQTDRLPI